MGDRVGLVGQGPISRRTVDRDTGQVIATMIGDWRQIANAFVRLIAMDKGTAGLIAERLPNMAFTETTFRMTVPNIGGGQLGGEVFNRLVKLVFED